MRKGQEPISHSLMPVELMILVSAKWSQKLFIRHWSVAESGTEVNLAAPGHARSSLQHLL